MRQHTSRRAFTLLEVVIASLLVAVLMASVYQALFIYRKLFERGETQTEEIQLVQTLSQQLSDDLVGAIQDPIFIDPKSRGPSGARRFGLFGNSTELRIDVLQIPAFPVAPTPTAQEMENTTKPRKLQAPELRTVYYSFYQSVSADSTLPDARAGLTRRELDFETPEQLDREQFTGVSDVSFTGESPAEEVAISSGASTFDQLLEVGMDSAVMWAPEVVSLQFRYFDGSKWRNSWDSLARKGLPVAVEMTFAVTSIEDADTIRGTAGGMAQAADVDSLTEEQELIETEPSVEDQEIDLTAQQNLPLLHMHRVVVHLPNSPLQKELQPVKRQAAPTLEVPTLTAPAPLGKAVLQPARSKRGQRTAPDQWMRNE